MKSFHGFTGPAAERMYAVAHYLNIERGHDRKKVEAVLDYASSFAHESFTWERIGRGLVANFPDDPELVADAWNVVHEVGIENLPPGPPLPPDEVANSYMSQPDDKWNSYAAIDLYERREAQQAQRQLPPDKRARLDEIDHIMKTDNDRYARERLDLEYAKLSNAPAWSGEPSTEGEQND